MMKTFENNQALFYVQLFKFFKLKKEDESTTCHDQSATITVFIKIVFETSSKQANTSKIYDRLLYFYFQIRNRFWPDFLHVLNSVLENEICMPSGDRRYECCSIDENSSGWWLKNDMNCRPGEKNHISNIVITDSLSN